MEPTRRPRQSKAGAEISKHSPVLEIYEILSKPEKDVSFTSLDVSTIRGARLSRQA